MSAIKSILSAIEGVTIFPMIAFFLFFFVFILMLVWVMRLDRKQVELLSNLPFENSSDLRGESGSNDG